MLAERSILNSPSHLPMNPRHFLAEAAVFLYKKLRTGTHPFHIDLAVREALPLHDNNYMSAFLKSITLMQENLNNRGKFTKLPLYATYLEFMGSEALAPSAPPMDKWCIQTLEFLLSKDESVVPEKFPSQTEADYPGTTSVRENTDTHLYGETDCDRTDAYSPHTPNHDLRAGEDSNHWSTPPPAPKKRDPHHLRQHKQTRSEDFSASGVKLSEGPVSPSPRASRFSSGLPKGQSTPIISSKLARESSHGSSRPLRGRVVGSMIREYPPRTRD
ncbi:hypothetical protein BDZ45DRAFT_693126 [Acephala macrosclerotiorum]|nr:hypothetical protein BDZ45DRAFT_693126 [Acephala macrosclerotiorum]